MFSIIPRRNSWFLFSGGLIVASIFSVAVFGLNFGIDFTGGTRAQIHFENARPGKDELKQIFETTLGTEKGEKVFEVLDRNDLLVRSRTLSEDDSNALSDAIAKAFPGAKIVSINTIGSSVGAVFKERAIIAVSLALLAIILYVAFAFRTVPEGYSSWKFGVATIIALAHDIIILVGFFALLNHFLGNEVDSLFITAVLTILGYSVNDTIVIFDRLRENLLRDKTGDFEIVAENAVWQTMRRSMNTTITTALVILVMVLFFLGFDSLFSFFLALTLGVIVGAYSSIFVAAPLLVSWHKK